MENSELKSNVNEIATLAQQAKSMEITSVTAPIEMIGVPKEIPILKVNGEIPKVDGLDKFFEPYRLHPSRKKGVAKTTTLSSFIDLINRHKTGDSAVFADTSWEKPVLTAVIDYHPLAKKEDGKTADFLHHILKYEFPLSEEWKAWINMNGKTMSQADFAEFIEDRIADTSAPIDSESEFEHLFQTKIAMPNELINLSRGLKINVQSKVSSEIILASGQGQIIWEESHRDSAGRKITVPGIFMLNIPLFYQGVATRIPVRLRYRIKSSGEIIWFYNIYRTENYITERVQDDLKIVAESTQLPTFEGSQEVI